jgi:beta-glucosidase
MSTEQRAKFNEATKDSLNVPMNYGLNLWGPNINLFDKSLWGRGQETYGEDPYLTGQLAAAFIGGLQGDLDPPTPYFKVVATAKHFAAYQVWSGVTRS